MHMDWSTGTKRNFPDNQPSSGMHISEGQVSLEAALSLALPLHGQAMLGNTQHDDDKARQLLANANTPASKPTGSQEITMQGPMPRWAQELGLVDRRGTIPWDSD